VRGPFLFDWRPGREATRHCCAIGRDALFPDGVGGDVGIREFVACVAWGHVMGESSAADLHPSNLRGRKNAPRKIPAPKERISFRDLVRFASPRKPVAFLVERTGADESTAKRWMRGTSRAPASAAYRVLGDIIDRLE
jgi:hypothetical protein